MQPPKFCANSVWKIYTNQNKSLPLSGTHSHILYYYIRYSLECFLWFVVVPEVSIICAACSTLLITYTCCLVLSEPQEPNYDHQLVGRAGRFLQKDIFNFRFGWKQPFVCCGEEETLMDSRLFLIQSPSEAWLLWTVERRNKNTHTHKYWLCLGRKFFYGQ